MGQRRTTNGRWASAARLLGLLGGVALLALLFSPVHAQDQGTATPASTPGEQPVVRMEIGAPKQPIDSGQEFGVSVLVDNVQHLASFDFTIQFDPQKLEPVQEAATGSGTPEAVPTTNITQGGRQNIRVDNAGQFLSTSDRGQNVSCPVHFAQGSTVAVNCVTLAAPLCLGGPAGASGSGLLATVYFRSKGGGATKLTFAKTTLIPDDLDPPCDPEAIGSSPSISHRHEDSSVELSGGSGGSNGAIIGVVAVVVVVLAAGAGGLLWYRRRAPGSPS